MSETVHYKGKLREVVTAPDETLEELCEQICHENLSAEKILEAKKWCDTYEEILSDELYEQYVVVNDRLFKVEEKKDCGNIDIFDISKNADGTYTFDVMYYNGGCSFDEAIGAALDKAEV